MLESRSFSILVVTCISNNVATLAVCQHICVCIFFEEEENVPQKTRAVTAKRYNLQSLPIDGAAENSLPPSKLHDADREAAMLLNL